MELLRGLLTVHTHSCMEARLLPMHNRAKANDTCGGISGRLQRELVEMEGEVEGGRVLAQSPAGESLPFFLFETCSSRV